MFKLPPLITHLERSAAKKFDLAVKSSDIFYCYGEVGDMHIFHQIKGRQTSSYRKLSAYSNLNETCHRRFFQVNKMENGVWTKTRNSPQPLPVKLK